MFRYLAVKIEIEICIVRVDSNVNPKSNQKPKSKKTNQNQNKKYKEKRKENREKKLASSLMVDLWFKVCFFIRWFNSSIFISFSLQLPPPPLYYHYKYMYIIIMHACTINLNSCFYCWLLTAVLFSLELDLVECFCCYPIFYSFYPHSCSSCCHPTSSLRHNDLEVLELHGRKFHFQILKIISGSKLLFYPPLQKWP